MTQNLNIFRTVAEAYEVLRDPVRRKQYEEMGHQGIDFMIQGWMICSKGMWDTEKHFFPVIQ